MNIDREKRSALISAYIERGWPVVPLTPKKKNPYSEEWNGPKDDKRRSACTLEDFGPEDNVGVQPAAFIDIDVDALEAVALAPAFLPATGCVFGRTSKPKSHWLYRCPEFTDYLTFKVASSDEMIVEMRTGLALETMFPPSIRGPKQGSEEVEEEVEWAEFGEIADLPAATILRAVSLLAAAAVIVRFYPEAGSRHPFGLALAGALRQLGLTVEEGRTMFRACAHVVADDQIDDRLVELEGTYRKDEADAIAGFKRLRESNKTLADTLSKVLGGVLSVRGFLSNPRTGIIDATHPENVKRVFEREGLALGWDSFYQMKTVTKDGRSMRVDDTVLIKVRMEAKRKHAITFAKEFWGDSIHDIATENPFHPVRDYLTELHWDGQPRIDTWLMKYLGAEDTIFNRTAGRLVLLAAVKRVIEPGAKFDQLLVLESKQGTGKSSSIAALCPNSEWYSDNLPIGAGSREVIEQTRGKWICEIAELFGMGKREIDQVKAFLSRQTDEARKVYARESDHVSRQFICIGTTNKQTYLQDPTGNRRFWPVKVSDSQDFEAVARDRDQLWAEAFESRASSLAFPRELWESAGILQREREDIHPWELKLTELIEQPKPEYLNRRTNGEVIGSEISITWEELFNVLDLNIDRRDKKSMGEISNIMVRLGFERANMRRDNTSNTRGWKRTR